MEIKEQERLLKSVLSQQSESKKTEQFREWIAEYILFNIPNAEIHKHEGNLYVTKGSADVFPCIVSHIDTVHDINHNVYVHTAGRRLFAFDRVRMEQYGIGGDDKVGVYICLQMLHDLPNVKCAFFRDEEIGCLGSNLAATDFFTDCAFILQCDRRGNSDFVDEIGGIEMYSRKFAKEIAPILKAHGYKEHDGMMTDVQALKRKINLCMANMSCGYYLPHSHSEWVDMDDVMNCKNMVLTICKELGNRQWLHKGEYRQSIDTTYYNGWDEDLKCNKWSDKWYSYHYWDKDTRKYELKPKYKHLRNKKKKASNGVDKSQEWWEQGDTAGFDSTYFDADKVDKNEEEAENKDKSITASIVTPEKILSLKSYPAGKASKEECPLCGGKELMYDELQKEDFCCDCTQYRSHAQKIYNDIHGIKTEKII